MTPVTRNEIKYQYLKLMHSGRSLAEIKALMRSVRGAFDQEYFKKSDMQTLSKLEGGLTSLTRQQAVDIMKIRFSPTKNIPANREEYMAQWTTGYKGSLPHNWKRDGNLVRRGRENKPRPGSSRGKIGKTKLTGAKQTLKNFELLVKTLQDLVRKYGKDKAGVDKIRKSFKIKRTVRAK